MIFKKKKESIVEQQKISVKQASILMGKSEQFLRMGLRNNKFPFGTAVKMSSQWTYYISPKLFYDYIGNKKMQRSA